ncbi:hypothetical protein [Noviherbaspirillum malthae]|uniref:hypothetical protein n=1 Tax=Noviherbaspirillum malthae TaxID=1260987 RepID=UPI00188E6EF3|nr:hypothetical protein [Noviherbaspirillum malthae]
MTSLFRISPITNRKQTGKIPGSSMRVSPPTLLELDLPAADRLSGFFLRYYRITLPVTPATQPRVSSAPAQACAGREAFLNIYRGLMVDSRRSQSRYFNRKQHRRGKYFLLEGVGVLKINLCTLNLSATVFNGCSYEQ